MPVGQGYPGKRPKKKKRKPIGNEAAKKSLNKIFNK